MIRATPLPDDANLALVEATTLGELQSATGTQVFFDQADPSFPFAAIVAIEKVEHLLGSQ